jgi:hypothetical protein
MATYYVRPDGADTNTGLAPNTAAGTGAFRTVNKALSVAVGGDTVWIAPGVYRENVAPTIAAQSTMMFVNGDCSLTQVAWGTGLTAGTVRITNNLTNDAGTPSGITISLQSKAFYTFRDIRFDGRFDVSNSNQIFFTECSFTGLGRESVVLYSDALASNFTVAFDRCAFTDVALATFHQQTDFRAHATFFRSCIFSCCTNLDRASITSPFGTISNFWYIHARQPNNSSPRVHFFNCTVIPGRSQPAYIFALWNWSSNAGVNIVNTAILADAITNTFVADRPGTLYTNNIAGFNLTWNQANNGGSNVTLTTYPVDNEEGYLGSVFNYLPYTPMVGSALIGSGSSVAVNGYPIPTTDFSNNAWNQTNPTIGYMDNRQVSTIPSTAGYVPLDRAIQTITTTAGSTGVSVHIYLGSTGVTFQTPNLTCYYARDNGASVQIPLVQGNASTWVSGGLFEVSSTTMPGVYKFDIPNAVIQAGAKSASIMLRGANAFNGAFVNVNIEAEPQPNYVSTNEFRLASEDAGYNNVLELNANTATTVKLQLLDMYQAPTNLTGATLSVEVYNSTNNLVASYTPTVRYAGNGEITFVLSTDVSATYGDYKVYCTKTSGSTDSVVYGPLSLRIRRL